MDTICIIPDNVYPGEGISRGLARGLLVYYGDCNLTGEGMGIGSIALRNHECTYFSRSWKDSAESGVLKRTFSIDSRMMWGLRGKPSTLLTRWIESGISVYMQLPWFQRLLMLPVLPFRTLLDIHPFFETIPPKGKATFTYSITGQNVEIQVEIVMPVRPNDTLCLLNELSAAWFTAGWDGQRMTTPPPAWEKVGSDQLPVSLMDPVHGIRFFMDQPSVSPSVPCTIYRGREQSGDLCWAGFCLELGPPDSVLESLEARYCIGFSQRAFP
jgi:hypothetical protein